MTRPPAESPAAWLVGAWRSDKAKTLEGWLYASEQPKAMREFLERDLGKLIHRFARKHSYTYSPSEGRWFRSTYRVLWQNEEAAFVVSGPKSREQGVLLRFVSRDLYWMHAGKNIEYFQRIPASEVPSFKPPPGIPQ